MQDERGDTLHSAHFFTEERWTLEKCTGDPNYLVPCLSHVNKPGQPRRVSWANTLFFLPSSLFFLSSPPGTRRCESGVSGARLSLAPGSRSELMISLDDLCLAIIQSIIRPAHLLSNNLCLAMALQYADMAYLALFIGLNGSLKSCSQSTFFHRLIYLTCIFMGSWVSHTCYSRLYRLQKYLVILPS